MKKPCLNKDKAFGVFWS